MSSRKQLKTIERPLTPLQELFCVEYAKDLNATQAAIRAGYSDKTARVQGTRLYANVAVRARIEEVKSQRVERVQVDGDWVVNRLVSVVERCMQAEPVMIFNGKYMEQKQNEQGQGVYQFDSAGANKALELLGKHLPEFFGKKVEDAGNIVQWVENKTYIDARSQHVHNHSEPTPTPQQITGNGV